MCIQRVLAIVLASLVCLLSPAQIASGEENSENIAAIQKFCEHFRREFQPSLVRHFTLDSETFRRKDVPPVITRFSDDSIVCQSARSVAARNPIYVFRLKRETEKDSWMIDGDEAYTREKGHSNPGRCGPVETSLTLVELHRHDPLNINHLLLDELLLHPGAKISGWSTAEDGKVSCVVDLGDAAGRTSRGLQIIFAEVLLEFQPDRHGWVPTRYEAVYPNGVRLISVNKHFSTVFGFSVPTKSVVESKAADGRIIATKAWEKAYEETAVPENVFYLSHYGVPDAFFLSLLLDALGKKRGMTEWHGLNRLRH